MQTQTITKEQAMSLIRIIKKAWARIKRAIVNTIQFVMRAIRRAMIAAFENRARLPNIENINYNPCITPFEKNYIQRIRQAPTVKEVIKLRVYDKNILKLECIQGRTRKLRVKKKLQKRINALQFKILMVITIY